MRLGYSVLKSGNILPPEIEMLREISDLKEKLGVCKDEAERKKLNKLIQEKTLGFNMTMERYKRKRWTISGVFIKFPAYILFEQLWQTSLNRSINYQKVMFFALKPGGRFAERRSRVV